MKKELPPEVLDQITQAILSGDRVEAVNMYISATESGLTDAQIFVRTLTTELKATHQDGHISKITKRRNIWQRLIFSVRV